MKRGKAGWNDPRENAEPEDDIGARIDYSALKPGMTKRFPSVLERYSVQRFFVSPRPTEKTTEEASSEEGKTQDAVERPCEDQWVCQHSNKLIIVGIAQTHAIFSQKNGVQRKVKNIDWTGSKGSDRQGLKVFGKGGRKGGIAVNPESVLCSVTMDDGTVYKLRACVRGSLLEVNPRLVGESGCELLLRKPASEAYLAIIRPYFHDGKSVTDNLLSREQYCALRNVPLESTFLNPSLSSSSRTSSSSSAATAAETST